MLLSFASYWYHVPSSRFLSLWYEVTKPSMIVSLNEEARSDVTVVWPKTNSGSNPLISNSAFPHLITDNQIFSWAWNPNFGLWTPQTKKLFFQFEMHSMEPRFFFSSSSSIYAWGTLQYFSTLIKHKLLGHQCWQQRKYSYHHNIKESFFMS